MDELAMVTKASILDTTKKHFDLLHSEWSHMFADEYCQELMQKLDERVRSFYFDLLTETGEKKTLIKDNIDALRREASDVTRLLHRSVNIGEKPDDVSLSAWQEKLEKSIAHLREELRERLAEISELLLQQKQLCEELSEEPLPLPADPLPKPQEMHAFQEHLSRLRAERVRRMQELFQLRSQIKQDMKVLELTPQTTEDERLLSLANQCLTPKIFEKLRLMQKEFRAQVVELHERIDDMREKINVLWDRLQESDEFSMRRVREATEYTQSTYDVLYEELQRCQKLRRQNLKTFIEQLRLEINKWWDLTLKSQQERKRFSNYYKDCYNEDLLELHELELDDLKSFYNSNKEIFELFASRAEIWERMEALEAKANEPNRFNNRGGQLLKEERERKAIGCKLPKIEKQITELVQAYELRTRSPFLVHGENILEYMASDWERIHHTKEQQSYARKHTLPTKTGKGVGRLIPPMVSGTTTSRTPMSQRKASAMSTSTISLRNASSNWKLHSKVNNTAKSTGKLVKRKSHADENNKDKTPQAKRSLMGTLNSINPSPSLRTPSQRLTAMEQKAVKSPLRKVRVLKDTIRRSGGLGRRNMGKGRGKVTGTVAKATRKGGNSHDTDDGDEYTTDESSNLAPVHDVVGNYGKSTQLPSYDISCLPKPFPLKET